ncbi:hypothetical protein OVY01_04795 [Robbsia sp. Bb-Pol-6]|uniref:Uncharacterized protein n=1 Tax=Robbsia betulipollinis TaxID=2981849 RepID=A0ABT3ZJU8_9BURK|nr:hypothetical protein [Robbsia betulipollinis]MCY0386565.1 hypothetical protein [Robbsia betulipollinis]
MSEVPHVLWTFLPGQREVDSFAYLNDVRLALRDIRLSGVRPITQVPTTGVVSAEWDSVIKTYSIPFVTAICPVLMACAAAWLQEREGRSLRVKTGHTEVETAALGDIESVLGEVWAERMPA